MTFLQARGLPRSCTQARVRMRIWVGVSVRVRVHGRGRGRGRATARGARVDEGYAGYQSNLRPQDGQLEALTPWS